MADAWDAEDFDVPDVNYKRPEEIEAEEAAKAAAAEAARKAQAEKAPKPKPARGNYESNEPQRELTAKEREELQKKHDLRLAQDLFGGDGEDDSSYKNLDSEKEFIDFADKLSASLTIRNKSDHFPAFLGHLMYKLCSDLDSKHIRKLSTEIKALADLKANEEKTKKVSTKPTIKASATKASATKGVKGGVYDDFLDGSGGGAGDYGDYDEDFM